MVALLRFNPCLPPCSVPPRQIIWVLPVLRLQLPGNKVRPVFATATHRATRVPLRAATSLHLAIHVLRNLLSLVPVTTSIQSLLPTPEFFTFIDIVPLQYILFRLMFSSFFPLLHQQTAASTKYTSSVHTATFSCHPWHRGQEPSHTLTSPLPMTFPLTHPHNIFLTYPHTFPSHSSQSDNPHYPYPKSHSSLTPHHYYPLSPTPPYPHLYPHLNPQEHSSRRLRESGGGPRRGPGGGGLQDSTGRVCRICAHRR